MAFYMFYQPGGEDPWEIALASERENIIGSKKPEFVSVLDVDNSFDSEMTRAEIDAVKYAGPMYWDFDGDLTEVIPQVKEFLNSLKSHDLNLETLRIFATGGRGFHVEAPAQLFMAKVPPAGIAGLPFIYREMAWSLMVDTMDMRVYSSKRGRMWRTPNVKRSNGAYKVQITVDEAMEMSVENYDRICSSPRAAVPTEPATFNPNLGLIYSRAKDKVDGAIKKRRNRKPSEALKYFNGQWPDTVKSLMEGDIVKDGVGWNRIAMQLALTADGLGKTEEELLDMAQPLLETYQGDSARYGTRLKRRRHLQEMFHYLAGNPCYEWDAKPIMALIKPDHDASDLTNGEYTPDDGPEDSDAEDETEEDGTFSPVRVNKNGIFVRAEDGWKQASCLGIGDPSHLISLEDMSVGYDVEIFIDGKSRGRHILETQKLASKQQLQSFALTWSAAVTASDNQVTAIADVLRRRTERKNSVTYTVQREGVDMVRPLDAETEADLEMIWASPYGCISHKGRKYKFSNALARDGSFSSDLMRAPDLENTKADAELVEALLELNQPLTVARLLGWFSAAFLCQPLRHVSMGKYPILQVYGQAEAGKSRTVGYYNRLHYYMNEPREIMSGGGTQYPALVACATSASMPVVFEEFKRSELPGQRFNFLRSLLRSSYDGHNMERGTLTSDSGPKSVNIQRNKLVAPVAFVGEAIEDQTAILDRSITVSMNKEHRKGRAKYDRLLEGRRVEIGKVGKLMAMRAMALKINDLKEEKNRVQDMVIAQMDEDSDTTTRLSKALAVPLVGLRFLKSSLASVFGSRFDQKLIELQDAILANITQLVTVNMSEASKVLDVLAQLTRLDDEDHRLVYGVDYDVRPDGLVEINLKPAFAKYLKYQRSLGLPSLYSTDSAFVAGMHNYAGARDKVCAISELRESSRQMICAFDPEYMDKEGVESFKAP